MGRSMIYVVSDDYSVIERARAFGHSLGVQVEVMSPSEWDQKSHSTLASGTAPVQGSAKILAFPSANTRFAEAADQEAGKVRTINELESLAIENAIFEFNGNLTEAAKALGIGRATLYRKVKQYNIDPSAARRKRAA
jgi:DNA-binding NtrC family response regulator